MDVNYKAFRPKRNTFNVRTLSIEGFPSAKITEKNASKVDLSFKKGKLDSFSAQFSGRR